MHSSLPPAATLFATPQLAEYDADLRVRTEKALLDATIDERPFAQLTKPGWGRPAWPAATLLRALVLQRQNAWHDRVLIGQLQDNARVRYLVGLPLGTRVAPSRTTLGDFRRKIIDAKLGTELFTQQVRWICANTDLINPARDAFGADATRFEAAAAQPTVIGLLQHAIRRVLLAARDVAPEVVAKACARLGLEAWLAHRFQRCSHGLNGRKARRLWARCYSKAEKLLRALSQVEEAAELRAAIGALRRIMDERGPEGTAKPADRLTNALDLDARFGCKGYDGHRITWNGTKVSVVAHLPTDLIVAMDVMPANAVDGSALVRCADQAKELLQRATRNLHADAAYTSEGNRRALLWRGITLVGPRLGKVRHGRVAGGGRVAGKLDRATRSGIERVQANMVRWRGNRRAWYVGLAKCRYQGALSALTANLVRLTTLVLTGKLQLPSPALVA